MWILTITTCWFCNGGKCNQRRKECSIQGFAKVGECGEVSVERDKRGKNMVLLLKKELEMDKRREAEEIVNRFSNQLEIEDKDKFEDL